MFKHIMQYSICDSAQEILSIFDGNGVAVKMTYDSFGEPLRVMLVAEEDDYVVQAKIHTLDSSEPVCSSLF